jgi:integrase
MSKPAKPFKYRQKWRAQLTLKNGQRLTRDFPVGQHDDAVRWLAEQRANADSIHEPQLGGPTKATLAQALNLYAHLYTILKGGAGAELTRINHYLEAEGLQALQLVTEDDSFKIVPKPRRALPRPFAVHREERMQKRAQTYAQLAELARKPCSRISKADIRVFIATMAQEGLSPSTIQKEIALLKAMFNKAISEWEWTTFKNPCAGIKLGESVPRFVILSKEERAAFFKALAECDNLYFWPLVSAALLSSLRRRSLLTLRWEHIDFEHRVARVGSKTGLITVPMSQTLVEVLKSVPGNQDNGPVFPVTEHAVNMCWERVREKIGRPDLQFRDLRHIAATDLAKKGASSEILRRFLQHKTSTMANLYINLTQHDMNGELDKLQREGDTIQLPPRNAADAKKARERRTTVRLVDGKRRAKERAASESGLPVERAPQSTVDTHQVEARGEHGAGHVSDATLAPGESDAASAPESADNVVHVQFGATRVQRAAGG